MVDFFSLEMSHAEAPHQLDRLNHCLQGDSIQLYRDAHEHCGRRLTAEEDELLGPVERPARMSSPRIEWEMARWMAAVRYVQRLG